MIISIHSTIGGPFTFGQLGTTLAEFYLQNTEQAQYRFGYTMSTSCECITSDPILQSTFTALVCN